MGEAQRELMTLIPESQRRWSRRQIEIGLGATVLVAGVAWVGGSLLLSHSLEPEMDTALRVETIELGGSEALTLTRTYTGEVVARVKKSGERQESFSITSSRLRFQLGIPSLKSGAPIPIQDSRSNLQ